MKKDSQNIPPVVHMVFIVILAACALWVYTGIAEKDTDGKNDKGETVQMSEHSMMDMHMDMDMGTEEEGSTTDASSTPNGGAVQTRDDAARAFLNAAQDLAEVYRFTNGSYAGLCEQSDDHLTLEGESGGVLKYVKFVGATEVYCFTGDTDYMVEVKLPESGMFYCIDDEGTPVEQAETREEAQSCA